MMCSLFKDEKVFQFFIHLFKGGAKHIIIYISNNFGSTFGERWMN